MQDKRPICAIATAPGQGAIGVVRVSAPEPDIITALAADILGPERRLVARKAAYGPFLAADAQPIDYGLALWFPAPHSYTGEHILELQGHGGPVVQQILLRRVLQVGAAFGIRLAEPGEFTERAFLNDKLDLVQAEAVADLIEASTEQAARSATRSLQGVFSRQIDDLAEQLLTLRMLVEATLDFPEEEIDFLQKADAAGRLARIDDTLRRLFDTAQSGARLRQGLNVVLTGAPNVGKSSLLNALAGAEVAIVTPIAGTTRDRVIEQISIEGVPINLIDTAGLRRRGKVHETVEKFSVVKTLQAIEDCNVAVLMIDAADGISEQDSAIAGYILEAGRALVIALNKWDAVPADERRNVLQECQRRLYFLDWAPMLTISALKNRALDKLMKAVDEARAAATRKLSTPKLTRMLHAAVLHQQPPRNGPFRPKLRYAHQGGQNPPVIVVHGSSLDKVGDSYRRFLEGWFRERLALQGTPLRIEFRTGANPYANRGK